MARAYRKKPVVIEAVQWTGENHAEMCEFIDPEVFEIIPREGLVIHTLEGDHHASPGDYIIKGVNGEFYPCKPDIFAKTYESATLTPQNDPLTIELKDKLCYVGVDLSTSRDMTAFAWRFPPQPGLVTADWLLGQVLYDIQAMPTLTPPNEPLTLEELREMDGEPVWVVLVNEKFSGLNGWYLVHHGSAYLARIDDWELDDDKYGVEWLAYRRPPEGEV